MISRPVVVLAGEGDLGDAWAGGQRLAGLQAKAVDDIEGPGRQQIADQVGPEQDRGRGLFGGLDHHAVAGGQRWSQLPAGHQQREIPGDDLAHHAQGLVEVIGDRIAIDFGDPALLGADAAGEIAEVVDGQRQVGGGRLADRLAVVPGLGGGQEVEIFLHPLGHRVQDHRALGGGGPTPGVFGGVGRVQGGLDVLLVGASHLAERLAVHGRGVLEIAAGDGFDPLAADEVAVTSLEGRLGGAL
jgi:hypothetical protein